MTGIVEKIATARLVEILTPGAQGPAGTIAIGRINSVAPGQPARVENRGTPSNAVLDIDLPQSDPSVALQALMAATVQAKTDAQASAAAAAASAQQAATAASAAGVRESNASTSATQARQSADSAAALNQSLLESMVVMADSLVKTQTLVTQGIAFV